MTKYLRISSYIRKPFLKYDYATDPIWISLYMRKIFFSFYQCGYYSILSCTDDGLIDESDLREVMKACMVENGMEFDEKEVSDLANALFEDAVQVRKKKKKERKIVYFLNTAQMYAFNITLWVT